MSIISEALKKLQAERSGQVISNDAEEDVTILKKIKAEGDNAVSSKELSRLLPVIVITLVICVVVFLFVLILGGRKQVKAKAFQPGKAANIADIGTGAAVQFKQAGRVPVGTEKMDEDISGTEQDVASPDESSEHSAYAYEKPPVLSGIMYSPANPQAIMNGKMVRQGETVGGFEVKKILADKVICKIGDQEVVIKLQ